MYPENNPILQFDLYVSRNPNEIIKNSSTYETEYNALSQILYGRFILVKTNDNDYSSENNDIYIKSQNNNGTDLYIKVGNLEAKILWYDVEEIPESENN